MPSQTHSGPTLAERDGLAVIDCRWCGYAHLCDMPTADGLTELYENFFWQRDKAEWLVRYEKEQDYWQAMYGDWMSILNIHVPARTLLDVGSGYGFFLDAAKAAGWSAEGLEPNTHAYEYSCKRHTVARDVWRHGLYNYRMFDCISALWVLEHMPAPLYFLKWCHSHLYSSGAVLLAVPNDFSWKQSCANAVARQKNWWIDRTHLNYFTPVSLANLLGRVGFRLVERLGTFQMENFILVGQDYSDDEEVGQRVHKQARMFNLQRDRPSRLMFAHEEARMAGGRDIIVIAECD